VKYHYEISLNKKYGLKNEGQDCKTGPIKEVGISGRGEGNWRE
jgi:hypothetical protein